MRLLVDANISHRLCKKVSDLFENVLHVEDTNALIQIIRNHYNDILDLYSDDSCGILEIV